MHRSGRGVWSALMFAAVASTACSSEVRYEIESTRRMSGQLSPVVVESRVRHGFSRHAMHAAPAPIGETRSQPVPGVSGGTGSLAWTAPEGWTSGPSKSAMRLVSFRPGGDSDLDAYIVILPGRAGGEKDNIDRWLGQVGLPNLTDPQFDALPRIDVLGRPSPVIDALGAERGILGLVASFPGEDKKVFVKMTGPVAKVERTRAAFIAFCQSLAVRDESGEGAK